MRAMERKGLGSELPNLLKENIRNPINFKPLTQDLAHGYVADVLSRVAEAVVNAGKNGKLTSSQESLARQAQVILNAFAKVGVIALIDEATGYQHIRDPSALRILVQQYIEEEKSEWQKTIP